MTGDERDPVVPVRSVATSNGPGGSRRTMVITNNRDENDWQRRELHEEADGSLVIEGHDLGSGVSDFWGAGLSEYEFTRTLSTAAVADLRRALGIGQDPLLEAVASRFETTGDLESYLKESGIESTFWSRVGD